MGIHNTTNDRIALSAKNMALNGAVNAWETTVTPATVWHAGSISVFAELFIDDNDLTGDETDMFVLAGTINSNSGGSAASWYNAGGITFSDTADAASKLNEIFRESAVYGGGQDMSHWAAMNVGTSLTIQKLSGSSGDAQVNAIASGPDTDTPFDSLTAVNDLGGYTDLDYAGLKIDSTDTAKTAVQMLDQFLDNNNTMLASVGAEFNRLTSALNNIEVGTENLASAKSQIRDADFAHETAVLAKNQIMTQASTSVLAQANQVNQGVLRLLG